MKQLNDLIEDIEKILASQKVNIGSTAVHFNVFNILNITTDEVRLHSRFLAELLNPLGTHGQGTVFLEKFLTLTNCSHIFTEIKKTRVIVEQFIGAKTENSGGRIDILLLDDNNCAVIIENKIYAGDQENQLLRYYNYGEQLKKKKGNYAMLYLTLLGNSASDFSHGDSLNSDSYQTISYSSTIQTWLEECIEEIGSIPKLAVALQHYKQLIDQLTGKNMNELTEQEIIDRIKMDTKSFETAVAIENTMQAVRFQLMKQFGENLKTKIFSDCPEIRTIEMSDNFGKRWQGMEMYLHESGDPENRPPHIRFSFLREMNECYIEIHPGIVNNIIRDKDHEKRKKYIDCLNESFVHPVAKVMNTEYYWQGEWVCLYYKMNDRFVDLISDHDRLLDEILEDLSVVIKRFSEIESFTTSSLSV